MILVNVFLDCVKPRIDNKEKFLKCTENVAKKEETEMKTILQFSKNQLKHESVLVLFMFREASILYKKIKKFYLLLGIRILNQNACINHY